MKIRYNFTIIRKLAESKKDDSGPIVIKKARAYSMLPDGTFFVERDGSFVGEDFVAPCQWFPSHTIERIDGEMISKFESKREKLDFFKDKLANK